MARRRALASASAVLGLAAGLLAMAGGKVEAPTAAQASASAAVQAQSGTSAVTRSGPRVIEPGAGFSPVYSLINRAKHSIDVTMYEFADTTAEHDLAAAAKRGACVHVILDRREQSENATAYSYLGSRGVTVTWSSPSYHYTHQKTLIIDGAEAVIMTANLTSEYYATSRDFLVLDTNRPDVSAITAVFNADLAHRAIRPSDGSDLVWSPTDAQDNLKRHEPHHDPGRPYHRPHHPAVHLSHLIDDLIKSDAVQSTVTPTDQWP
jgi:cardiolipin synthase